MYRLEVKLGRKWKLGLVVYKTLEDANERAEYMKLVGQKKKKIKDWEKKKKKKKKKKRSERKK